MSEVVIQGHTFKMKITASKINKAVADVAQQINTNFENKKPLFIAVLNGSFMFASDLMKNIKIDCEISFIKVASYQNTSSTGKLKQLIGMNEDIKGRTIIIIEDIVDTGNTIENVWQHLKELGAKEISVATLLFKKGAYTKSIPIDYAAIVVSNEFLVGYGLDYNGLGRNFEDIYVLDNKQKTNN